MKLGMYKPGQGYWTRVFTAVGAGALAVGAAFWINGAVLPKAMAVVSGQDRAIVWAAVLTVTALILWRTIVSSPRVVEFMIATEAEMKKVVWPTRQALISMTWVVIGALLGLAVLVYVIDFAFTALFKLIHIL